MEGRETAEVLNGLLLEHVPAAVAMFDRDMRYLAHSKRWLTDYGLGDQDIIGRSHYEVFPEMDGRWRDVLARALQGETLSCDEDTFPRGDGSVDWVQWEIVPWRDGGGEIGGVILFTQTVTERIELAQAAQASTEHLHSILATVPDAMVVIDVGGRIQSFSATAEKMFGYAEAEVIGKHVSLLMPAPYRELHDSYLQRLHSGDRKIIGQARTLSGLRRNGEVFPLEICVGEAGTNGQTIYTGFIRDLTEQQRTAARLEELRSELIHVARVGAMGTMASTLAHELNQPIAAVVSYVEGARNLVGEEEPLVSEALKRASSEAMRAGDIVRRLRNFVARGEVESRFESLVAVVNEALALVGASVREKGASITIALDPAFDTVLIDRVQIEQVLINLVRNAVEALAQADAKHITLSSAPENDHYVRVTVADSGKGISSDAAENLFRAFTSSKADGLGLGLSICRTIVEANGGRIWFEARPEGGAMFHFTVRRGPTEPSRSADREPT